MFARPAWVVDSEIIKAFCSSPPIRPAQAPSALGEREEEHVGYLWVAVKELHLRLL